MNSNLLYKGDYYAWHPYRPKGQTPIGAAKVRVGGIRRTKSLYGKNRRTEVEITIVERHSVTFYKEGSTHFVPAREILDTWDSYKDEEALLIGERDRRNLDQRRKETHRAVLQNLISAGLLSKGLPSGQVSIDAAWVHIPTDAVLDWLEIPEETIEEAVENALGPQATDDDRPDFLSLLDGG